MARILVVDDAVFMRTIIKSILANSEYNVVGEASNGAEAIVRYRELRPDIVTLDITMPIMDGIQALKGIKAEFPDAKVVMCSAMGQQALVIEAVQAGAMDFIIKPFNKERVFEALHKVVNNYK